MSKIIVPSAVVRNSKAGTRIYYDFETHKVNTSGKGHFVTLLLRKNTAEEIRQAVERWLNL